MSFRSEVTWRTAELGLAASSDPVRLRFSLAVDRHIADKGWALAEVMVTTGTVRTTDLQLNLARQGDGQVVAGSALTYTLTLTNAGPDTLDALVSGFLRGEKNCKDHLAFFVV